MPDKGIGDDSGEVKQSGCPTRVAYKKRLSPAEAGETITYGSYRGESGRKARDPPGTMNKEEFYAR